MATLFTLAAGGCTPTTQQYVERGTTYLEQGQYQPAIIELRNAAQREPLRADIRLKLGEAYLHANDGPAALREYVRAADLRPDDHDTQIKAGKLLLLAGAFEDAQARGDQVLREDPRNVHAQILRGNALVGLRDLEGAIASYEAATSLGASSDRALFNIGVVQRALGRTRDAEAAFQSAIEAAPDSISPRLALGHLYWASGRESDAERSFKSALALDASSAGIHRVLGTFYVATGRDEEAAHHFATIASHGDDSARLTLAHYYAGSNRLAEARSLLEELARTPSAKASATVRLAAIDAMEGRRAEGLYRVLLLLDDQPSNTNALMLAANLLRLEGRREEAMALVQRVLGIDGAAPAYLLAGRLYAEQDRNDEAVEAFERVLQLDARPFAAFLELARLHFRLGSDKALAFGRQAVALHPRSVEARALLIRAELQWGDVERALAEVDAFERTASDSADRHALAALVERARNRTDEAYASYTRALSLEPQHLEALEGITQMDVDAGRDLAATARLDAALASSVPTPDLLLVAARGYAAAGDPTRSERVLQQTIDADPSRLEAYELLGRINASRGRLAEAIKQFQDLVAKYPKSESGHTMLGMLFEMQGLMADAEAAYKRALAVNSRAPVAANNLAYIYVTQQRELDEALALANVAQQQLPYEPNVSDTLGWIYVRKQMLSRALPHLEASASAMPDHPVVLYHLGIAYYQYGHFSKARPALERALQIDPKFVGAEEARKALTVVSESSPIG